MRTFPFTRLFIISAALVVALGPLEAADINSGGRIFLLGGGARAVAMRGAYTAAAGEVDSIFYNPGGLASVRQPELSFTHAVLLGNVDYDVAEFAYPARRGTWAVSLTRLAAGKIEGRDINRMPTGDFNSEDMVGTLAYSKDFRAMAGIGASFKFFKSRIGSDEAATAAMDLGIVGRWSDKPLWLGFSVLNLGPGIRYVERSSPLPLTFAVGAAGRLTDALNLTLDAKRNSPDRKTDMAVGMEYAILSSAWLRGGYLSSIKGGANAGVLFADGFQGGIGVMISRTRLDYAISSSANTSIETVHRISLSTSF